MIVVRIYEGLGNQMFEYAYAYALSKRMKHRKGNIYIDIRDEAVSEWDRNRFYRPIEINQFRISLQAAPIHVLKKWEYIKNQSLLQKAIYKIAEYGKWNYQFLIEENYNFDKKYYNIKDNMYVSGWFQHGEYFENVRDDLLREFTLKQEFKIPDELDIILKRFQVVSLHIRRGDYVSNLAVKKVMCYCGKEYYQRAIRYMNERLENIFLFIFTNDEEWVQRRLKLDLPYRVISNHYHLSDIQEMILMSKCKHNIIANSTFSWWGAWLNENEDKIVIAPKKWFVEKKRRNIAKKEWVQL